MQLLKDKLLIRVDKETEDEVQVGNINLHLDTSYERNWHVRIYGEVVALPRGITVYNPNGAIGVEPFDSLYDVELGDRVYFHFHVVNPANRLDNYIRTTDVALASLLNEFSVEDIKNLYILDHRQLFCAVRFPAVPSNWSKQEKDEFLQMHKRIIMQGDRVLVQPKMESWDAITSAGGLILKSEPEPIPLTATVRHIGKPAKGYPEELYPGDDIYLTPDSEFENTIEGEKYWICRQSDIVGKYINI